MDMVEYYTPVKKELVPSVTVWMDLEGFVLSQISQSVKYHMISLIYGS